MRWDGSVAVITGASRGIGRAVAVAAARAGATVGLIARSKGDLEDVLGESGGRGAIATADVGSRSEVEAALAALTAELGPVDILVNNAGIGGYGAFVDTPVEDIEQMARVNHLGTVYATKAVLPAMLERRRGHIVNVSSIAGRIGAPMEAGYSASKFAVSGLTDALSLELAHTGVGVSQVCPGPVETNFFDARGVPYKRTRPKPVSADRVARAVIEAVERGRAEVMVPRWLRFPSALKATLPRAFRMGALRDFGDELKP